jgi:RimJ/RimL family protein N-acetyltransferase
MVCPEIFETARLRAERLRPDHLSELRRMHVDPDVMQHIGGVFTEEQTLAYYARASAHWDAHGHGFWQLYDRETSASIGRAVLRHMWLDDVDEMETGYAFHPPYWGRGYATEITRACLDLGFRTLRVPSVVAVTTLTNAASQHVLIKCGFRHDRNFRRGEETLSLFRVDAP